MDASNKPEVEQKGDNSSVQEQPTHKRVPKRCLKCGKSVVNLSRHQKHVHGMKKLKRKLGDYFMGMKKKPKGVISGKKLYVVHTDAMYFLSNFT